MIGDIKERRRSTAAFAVIAGILGSPLFAIVEARGETYQVEISGFAFQPAELTLRVGDEVVWINRDIAPHTASANDGSWDSGALAEAARGSVVMTQAGEFPYRCLYHPAMRGQITVKQME